MNVKKNISKASKENKAMCVSHFEREIVEGSVVRASAAAETKLLLVDGFVHLHSLADRRHVTALICCARYSGEMCCSD